LGTDYLSASQILVWFPIIETIANYGLSLPILLVWKPIFGTRMELTGLSLTQVAQEIILHGLFKSIIQLVSFRKWGTSKMIASQKSLFLGPKPLRGDRNAFNAQLVQSSSRMRSCQGVEGA
jgi:hypothetical protein